MRLCADPSNVPAFYAQQVSAPVIVLGVVSSKAHVMPPQLCSYTQRRDDPRLDVGQSARSHHT